MTLLAVAFALLGACFFAGSVALQHDAVQTRSGAGRVRLTRLARSRTWQAGVLLGVTGTALHLTALSLAPLAIVQPLGVLSLVLTVLAGQGAVTSRRIRVAAAIVCVAVAWFVLTSASAPAPHAHITTSAVVLAVLAGPAVAAAGLACRGRARCLGRAAAAAVLFGLGAAVMRAAALSLPHLPAAAGFALAGGALIAGGGWLLQQAHAAGPTAVVVAATTVLDPLTAVAADQLLYGEAPHLGPALAVARLVLALAAVLGVLVLAGSLSGPSEPDKEPSMPDPLPTSGLRILLGADTFPPDINGAVHFTARLAHGLACLGHDVHVLRPRPAATTRTTAASPSTTREPSGRPSTRRSGSAPPAVPAGPRRTCWTGCGPTSSTSSPTSPSGAPCWPPRAAGASRPSRRTTSCPRTSSATSGCRRRSGAR